MTHEQRKIKKLLAQFFQDCRRQDPHCLETFEEIEEADRFARLPKVEKIRSQRK